ncbi:MAG: heme ABC transporter ATP-binding protein [Rhodospirillaceae bacterium]|nr:heme ABC transporter ATP-binding protein [Rhodospirillaceae bacterium]|tara:strand:+ start:1626 stop:2420 length:795 start_codon:yes stop_codon:yes gene_type:complete
MLAANAIHVSRGGNEILKGVDFALVPGEMVAIIGPNGAGKSTMLHALSGAVVPDSGRVTLDNAPLASWPRRDLARKRAVLPQASTLNFPFRTFEVVLLGRSPHVGRVEHSDDYAITEQAMREADILHLADRLYTTLSGGERQRVQFARALAQISGLRRGGNEDDGRAYLLLDEPTNNLDIAHQHTILRTARRLTEEGLGVMAVLHDPNLAATYADRIVVMRDGRVVADSSPWAVLTETLIADVFGVSVTIGRHPGADRPHVFTD